MSIISGIGGSLTGSSSNRPAEPPGQASKTDEPTPTEDTNTSGQTGEAVEPQTDEPQIEPPKPVTPPPSVASAESVLAARIEFEFEPPVDDEAAARRLAEAAAERFRRDSIVDQLRQLGENWTTPGETTRLLSEPSEPEVTVVAETGPVSGAAPTPESPAP